MHQVIYAYLHKPGMEIEIPAEMTAETAGSRLIAG